MSLDASSPRPLTVRLHEARGRNRDFVFDSFMPAMDPESEGEPLVKQIAVHEVIMRFPELTVRGFMSAAVRWKFLKVLSR